MLSQHGKSHSPIPNGREKRSFKPQTKKATQNATHADGKSQLIQEQKSHQEKIWSHPQRYIDEKSMVFTAKAKRYKNAYVSCMQSW